MMQAQDFPLISHSPRRWAKFLKGRTPILESIVPLDSRGRRHWMMLGDTELVAHTNWKLDFEGISEKMMLVKADSGLYDALCKRRLLGKLMLKDKVRDWAGLEDDELVAFAKRLIEGREIGGRRELAKTDLGLYQALKKRKLLDKLGLGWKYRIWTGMSEKELIARAKRIIEDKKIGSRGELNKTDCVLYNVLRGRNLLEKIGLEKRLRYWGAMKDDELVAYAKKVIEDNRIDGRKDLARENSGLYSALLKRNLCNKLGLEKKRRDWAELSADELIAYAKKIIEANGINERARFKKENSRLYQALWKRKIVDKVFSEADFSKHTEAVDGVLDALESFGDSK